MEVFHPEWLANPVLVLKKNKTWRMCVDYTSLNKACPKDPFALPQIDQVIDSTARVSIQEGQELTPGSRVDDLVDLREGKRIPGIGLVQAGVVDAHPKLPVSLGNDD